MNCVGFVSSPITNNDINAHSDVLGLARYPYT